MDRGTLMERYAVKTSMRVARAFWAVAVVGLPLAGGCEDVGDFLKTDRTRFLGPEKVVRQPEGSPINPILGTIGPTDRSREIIPNAAFPKEGDWSYTEEDYIIGTTDILDISVLDLFADGVETVLRRQVSDTGFIDLPLLPQRIKAEGYTKEELRVVIENVYRPDILREPTVSVTVAARRNDTFSVLGAVNRPGTYNILRKHMRLLEALALAGGITQTNIYYIYVIRPGPATRLPGKPRAPVTTQPFKLPPLPPEIKPTTVPATKPATKPAKEGPEAALRELGKVLPGIATQPATKPVKPSVVRFVEMSPAGSAPAWCLTMSAPTRWAQIPSCSAAAARKVSLAASRTRLPSWPNMWASLAMDVVFPEPFTPTSRMTAGGCWGSWSAVATPLSCLTKSSSKKARGLPSEGSFFSRTASRRSPTTLLTNAGPTSAL